MHCGSPDHRSIVCSRPVNSPRSQIGAARRVTSAEVNRFVAKHTQAADNRDTVIAAIDGDNFG